MLHKIGDEGAWFAPKRYGYGAGLPIRWQGWAVLIAYGALVGGASLLLPHTTAGRAALIALIVAATALLILITARRTRGGWRWRSGED